MQLCYSCMVHAYIDHLLVFKAFDHISDTILKQGCRYAQLKQLHTIETVKLFCLHIIGTK